MSRIIRAVPFGADQESPLDLDDIQQLPRCDQSDLLMGRLIRLEAEIAGTRRRIAERANRLSENVAHITHNPEVVAQQGYDLAADARLYQDRSLQRRQTQDWLGELGIEDWR